MTVYKGSTKIKDIYHGSTKIGKIYKGSKLVYQSMARVQLWGYERNNTPRVLIGSYNTSGLVANAKNGTTVYSTTISAISGTISASGSTVTGTFAAGTYTCTYNSTVTLNGAKVYLYLNSGAYCRWLYVLEKSVVGSTALTYQTSRGTSVNYTHPASVSSSNMVTHDSSADQTNTRSTTYDGYWTINGIVK